MNDSSKQLDQNKTKEPVPTNRITEQRSLAADNTKDKKSFDKKLHRQFYEKKCNVFCPQKNSALEKCQCGLSQNEHEKEVLEKTHGSQWDSVKCTRKTKWRCTGTIQFKSQNRINKESPYMRIADDVDVDKLVDYIHTSWNVPKPSLIISVTGGASDAKLKKEDHEKLKRWLQKMAAINEAWIITGGSNTGIMKICGEAVRDQILSSAPGAKNKQAVAIGIATWAAIPGSEEDLTPTKTHSENTYYNAVYRKPEKGSGLDPNHTHFILCDDGSRNQYGKEQKLRGKLERALSANALGGTKVPIVCVVVEGGPGTVDSTRNALLNNTPCIVFDGSGRAADVLAFAVKIARKYPEKPRNGIEQLVRKRTENDLGIEGDTLRQTVKWLMECLDFQKKIRIFNFDEYDGHSAGDLDKAILQTILEMGELDINEQLMISIHWNRFDMTDQIMRKNKDCISMVIKADLLTIALIENKFECIKIFAEHLDLESFLTEKKLEEIYNTLLKLSTRSFLHEILETKKGKQYNEPVTLENIQSALQTVTNVEYEPQYAYSKFVQSKKKQLKRSNKVHREPDQKSTRTDDEPSEILLKTFRNPERELFVFSLLFIRLEASEYFWENLLCKTSSAVFAVLISKKILMSSRVRNDRNLQVEVRNMHENYERQAKEVLNSCYVNNAKWCQAVLKVKHESWGSKTCIDLAIQADCKEFIAQSGCQTLLEKIWRGDIYENSLWKIIGATIFPFGVLFVVFDDDNETRAEKESPRRPLNESEPKQEESENIGSDLKVSRTKLIYRRYKRFYSAPIVTFILNVISMLLFLALFSAVTLNGLNQTPRVQEYVLVIWWITLALEDLRQLIIISKRSFKRRLDVFFANRRLG